MGCPRRLERSLSEYGYSMEIDVGKWDCSREEAHWHLCKNGRRIGQINTYGTWTEYPSTDVSRSVIKEAEDLTSSLSSQIRDTYLYNKDNGAD